MKQTAKNAIEASYLKLLDKPEPFDFIQYSL